MHAVDQKWNVVFIWFFLELNILLTDYLRFWRMCYMYYTFWLNLLWKSLLTMSTFIFFLSPNWWRLLYLLTIIRPLMRYLKWLFFLVGRGFHTSKSLKNCKWNTFLQNKNIQIGQLNMCHDLREQVQNNPVFLFKVVTSNESHNSNYLG